MTQFPHIQIYRNAKHYRDRNKSEKTISRAVIEQRIIPRFAFGSVETYGVDAVKSHDHPMLDQYFFSFPENENGRPHRFPAHPHERQRAVVHPPRCHAWHRCQTGPALPLPVIDFYPDNDVALKRLDASHIATGKHVEFSNNGELRR
jgi:hypothetical protein